MDKHEKCSYNKDLAIAAADGFDMHIDMLVFQYMEHGLIDGHILDAGHFEGLQHNGILQHALVVVLVQGDVLFGLGFKTCHNIRSKNSCFMEEPI